MHIAITTSATAIITVSTHIAVGSFPSDLASNHTGANAESVVALFFFTRRRRAIASIIPTAHSAIRMGRRRATHASSSFTPAASEVRLS